MRVAVATCDRLKPHRNLSIMNLAEFSNILQRRSLELAKEKDEKLRAFGLEIMPIENNVLQRIAVNCVCLMSAPSASCWISSHAILSNRNNL